MKTGGWTYPQLLVCCILVFSPRAWCRPSRQARDSEKATQVKGDEDKASLEHLKNPFSTNSISRLDPVSQLVKYGYMKESDRGEKTDKSSGPDAAISEPITRFQRFYGLNETGILDNATLTLMSKPRCGAPDIMNSTELSFRKKRYLVIARWRSRNLPYRVGSTSHLSQADVERVVARGFKTWSDVSSLTFRKVTSQPIIDISFQRRDHGDNDPFDGIGGVLAHAYFPQAGGDVHLDEDEPWSVGSYRGVNLFQIIAHELGHSLGLGHSDDSRALMYAYYRGYVPGFQLGTDDIQGIQALYGRNTNPTPTQAPPPVQPATQQPLPNPRPPPNPQPTQNPRPTQTPNPNPNPPTNPCLGQGMFDTIFSIGDSTYAIEGVQVYKLNERGVDPGYPKPMAQVLPGTTRVNKVYAALVITEDNGMEMLYLFEASYVWKFNENLIPQSRSLISQLFPGLPTPIDAVFYSQYYRAIYFFIGENYYRSNPSPSRFGYYPIDQYYPKPISIWKFGRRVDALFRWAGNNKIYFFAGNQYYRYSEVRLHVESSRVPYPRDVRTWWLGCQSTSAVMAQVKHESSMNNDTNDIQVFHEPVADGDAEDEVPKENSPRRSDMSEGLLMEGSDPASDPSASTASHTQWNILISFTCLILSKVRLLLS